MMSISGSNEKQMNISKPIDEMTDQELDMELNTLTVLRNSLQRFIPQDEHTQRLMKETTDRLNEAKGERNVRWGCLSC